MCFSGIASVTTGIGVFIVLWVVHTSLVMSILMSTNFRSREILFLVLFPLSLLQAHHIHGQLSRIHNYLAVPPTRLHILVQLFHLYKFRAWINPPSNLNHLIKTPCNPIHHKTPLCHGKNPPLLPTFTK